jgi:integrase
MTEFHISAQDIKDYPNKHPKINEWILTNSPTSQTNYIRYIIRFEHHSQTTIDQLLDRLEDNTIKATQIRTIIFNTLTTKDETNLDLYTSSIKPYTYWIIASFFNYYGYKLPKNPFKHQPSDDKRGYTKPELQQLIGYLDKPLEKLFAIMAAESGLRVSTILAIKWKHIKDDYNNRTDSIHIRLERKFHTAKGKKAGYTFIGTRGRQQLNTCIEAKLINTQDPEANIFPYTRHAIQHTITRAKNKPPRLDKNISPDHGFRYYFKAQIEAPIPPIDAYHQKMLMGRFNDTDAKNYSDRTTEILRRDYESTYPYLDYMNNTPQQTQELSTKQTQLQDTINTLNKRLANLEEEKEQDYDFTQTIMHQNITFLAKLPNEQFNEMILFLRAKREQIIDPQHPLTKATDEQIIQAIKTINANESNIVLKRHQIT